MLAGEVNDTEFYKLLNSFRLKPGFVFAETRELGFRTLVLKGPTQLMLRGRKLNRSWQ